jgi:hypothetical protein
MKLLVIGYDGGDSRVIEGMKTSFFSERFAQDISHQTNEDMWSRGVGGDDDWFAWQRNPRI